MGSNPTPSAKWVYSGHTLYMLGCLRGDVLRRLYSRADLFVLPGLDIEDDAEGFGIVFLEAALAGTPAVATRTGGMAEAVKEGVTGRLVPAGDPEAMEDAIYDLLTDHAQRSEMGQKARQRVCDVFAWPIIIGQYEDLLETVKTMAGNGGRTERE